jgi:hypothetical protein
MSSKSARSAGNSGSRESLHVEGPIYNSFAGTLSPRGDVKLGPSPIHEQLLLEGAIGHIQTAAHRRLVHSIRHSRTSGVVHTLAANEQQRAAKLASNRALDHKRHDVVETLYNLKRAHRNLLAEAWHEETVPTVPAPPRLIAVSMTKRMEEGDLGHLSTRPASAPPLHDRHRPWSARSTARVGSASLARAGSARRAVAHAHVPPSQACRRTCGDRRTASSIYLLGPCTRYNRVVRTCGRVRISGDRG